MDYRSRGIQKTRSTPYSVKYARDTRNDYREERRPVPAQESAQKRGVMPVINPTGYPFLKTIVLPSDVEALQKLQVKVDLKKIGQAPRAFSEILRESMNP